MKGIVAITMVALLLGCQEPDEVSGLTGNEISYELVAGSEYAVNGSISFRERFDGFTTVSIHLNGTDGTAKHPVHVHLGNISSPKADVAALLTPIDASTGESETILSKLADDSEIRYKDISDIKACIKIHLSDIGTGRDVILAGGNIGGSYTEQIASGRTGGIAACKSN